ncbi:MAG: Uncharacterised protein [SAR116 cluster bacterium]|nr:MAG: Uncharacterised protein [SAR116 cluster bacterium]
MTLFAIRLKNRHLQFFICFGGVLLTDALLSHYQISSWRYLSKPLIVLSLIGYFWTYKKELSKPLFQWGLCALLFSLAGDVFLMFTHMSAHFFTAGLGAFLLAHVFYILLFVRQRNKKLPIPWLQGGLLLCYAVLMGFLVLDQTGDLKIPVLVYITVITAMAFSSLMRKGNMTAVAYGSGVLGARFFLASDSLLALSMFRDQFPDLGFLVMISYGLAQALMVYSLSQSEQKMLSKISL